MPILSSQSGISAKALGLTSSQFSSFGDGYWGQLLQRPSAINYNVADPPSIDSSNNITFGVWYTDSTEEAGVIKVNSSGVLQWQKRVSTPQTDFFYGSTMDSSGNFIGVGRSGSLGYGYVAKFDPSGSLLWAKDFIGSYQNLYSAGVKTDSSNNIYLVGSHYTNPTNTWDSFVVKLDSSGSLQWQRFIGGTGQQSSHSVVVNSSGDIYASGTVYDSTYNTVLLVKYNSSGTLQWQKKISHTTNVLDGGLALDSSGDLYLSGFCGSALLMKFDPSGNVLWQKASSTSGTQWTNIFIDPSNNLYLCGAISSGFRYIAKYDTSGNAVYRRSLTGAAGFSGGISAKGSAIYISGLTSGGGNIGVTLYYLPDDGSKTGIYSIGGNTVVYTGYNDTDTSGPVVVATSTYTDSPGNFVFSTSVATITNDTFTQTIQY
jgi:hypothetical protein